jgi:hypothetical protein
VTDLKAQNNIPNHPVVNILAVLASIFMVCVGAACILGPKEFLEMLKIFIFMPH